MGKDSKIAWTDHTFNPWIGCQKVSIGCDHCYAERLMDMRLGRVEWGPDADRVRTSEANWRQPLAWNAAAQAAGRRDKVFCASLADWLDNKAPQEWRVDLARLIEATPNLDWLLLTKRIENFETFSPWITGIVPANVWLGVTCENQEAYDRRWPILAKTNSSVLFVSYEPAIGPLYLSAYDDPRPDWIIMGAESGPNARPMPEAWAHELKDTCEALGLPFFMKQMSNRAEPPPELFVRQFPEFGGLS